MAIIFSQGTQIAPAASAINIPGSVIQYVDNTQTVNVSFTTAAWTNTLATTITTSKTGNGILVEYGMNDRSDQGNGTWSLVYHRILSNGNQIMYSGYNGAAANHIGTYERTFLYFPPSAGTYTLQAQCLAHAGTAYAGTGNNVSAAQYLRLYEIGV